MNTRAKRWTYNGFSTGWHRFKKPLQERGLIGAGLTLKGLRFRMATDLRERGVNPRDFAGILGQKPASMPRWYSRDAVLAGQNLQTFAVLEANDTERVRSTRVVKP